MEKKLEFGEFETIYEVGSGGFGQVFLVKKKEKEEEKNKIKTKYTSCNAYILKTLKENAEKKHILALKNEIDILEKLNKEPRSPYIPILYGHDANYYQSVDGKNKIPKPYYVIDYYSKGNLYYYLQNNEFSEKHAKVIFKKIVEAIKFCHDKNICHLDIKPVNIVFDFEFNLILLDFGLSTTINDDNKNKKEYKGKKGTLEYECPQMLEGKNYTGDKADIFSLGVILLNLVSGSYGFLSAVKNDKYYKYIIENTKEAYETYSKIVLSKIKDNLTDSFKDLYFKMVSYHQENRPKIDEILEDEWLKEINELNEQEIKQLEDEIKDELKKIYKKLIACNEEIKLSDTIKKEKYVTRSSHNELFTNPDLEPKKISNDRININHHIIINNYLNAKEFMGGLYDKIDNCEKLGEDVNFIVSEEALKFRVIFEKDEKYQKKCVIDIELFKYDNENKYLLEFRRVSGEIPQYYKNFLIIKDIIKKENEEKKENDEKEEKEENKLEENILKL